MSLERPWEEPYDRLLDELSSHYPGEVTNREFPESQNGRTVDSAYFVYPMFTFPTGSGKARVSISEHPASGAAMIDSADNVEFLRIEQYFRTPFQIAVRQEGLFDRFQKFIGLTWEYQTGDEEFDRRYMLSISGDGEKALVGETEFRESIKHLEPFAALVVKEWGLGCTREITSASTLHFPRVRDFINRTNELTQIISRHT